MTEPEKDETKEMVVVGKGEEGEGYGFEIIIDKRGINDEIVGREERRWRIRGSEVNAGMRRELVSIYFLQFEYTRRNGQSGNWLRSEKF